MDIFRTLGSGSLSVTAMLDFLGKANTPVYGLGEDETATPPPFTPWLTMSKQPCNHPTIIQYPQHGKHILYSRIPWLGFLFGGQCDRQQ